jgi:ketosteroid isomerase-like protein
MAEENVEVVRAGFEASQRGGVDALLEFLAPEIEWEVRSDLPDTQVYRGHDGVRQLASRFSEVMDETWYRPEEFIAVGEHAVVVPLRWGGRGTGSGLRFEERRETWVFTVRGRKIARVREFATRQEALAAAGLGGPNEHAAK